MPLGRRPRPLARRSRPVSPTRTAAAAVGVGMLVAELLTACGAGSAPVTARSAADLGAGPASSAPEAAQLPSSDPATGIDDPAASLPASPDVTSSATVSAVTYRSVTVTAKVPFPTRTVNDATLAAGTRRVRTRGVAGVATLTYRVAVVNGVDGRRTLVRRVVTKAPVPQVTVLGTKSTRQCDPNYSGPCVPIASDVDCAGGSGNGPAYVQGPVDVIGVDIYGLDSDHDGVGCE